MKATVLLLSALLFIGSTSAEDIQIGTKVTLLATADGNPPPTFEWFRNDVAIGTGSTYVIESLTLAHAGVYHVKATNTAGSAVSAKETINAVDLRTVPVIATQPADGKPVEGQAFTLAVIASGVPAPTYQWRQSGVAIVGATNATLAFPAIVRASSGSYDVVVTNSKGSVTSRTALVDVLYPPSIPILNVGLASVVMVSRKTDVRLAVSVDGPDVRYEWRRNNVLLNATGPELNLRAVNPSAEGLYTVTARNRHGAVSSSARLVVLR